jgi:hypothetical protein
MKVTKSTKIDKGIFENLPVPGVLRGEPMIFQYTPHPLP